MLKVLHINQSDIAGGAAIAGYRLHQGLLNQGIDSNLLVGNVKVGGSRTFSVGHSSRMQRLEDWLLPISNTLGLNYLNLVSSFRIPSYPIYQSANILNFHNLHTGYFNYLAIPKLTENKPAVFTLHDMWSFTGHCAYSFDCQRWQSGCGNCPYPDTYPAIKHDNTSWEWRLKQWIYNHSNLAIIAPSLWLTQQAQKSLLGKHSIHHIPNGLNLDIFQPLEPELCRSILGIPANKKVILFSAASFAETRKGGGDLLKVLNTLPNSLKSDLVLLTLGSGSASIFEEINIPTVAMGYVESDRLKALAYSAADLFIFPTQADNLPLVLQESMACGTPMISFDIGGVPDLVRPNITGYLAPAKNFKEFTQGIIQLLEDNALREKMSVNCRQVAVEEYALDLQAKRYIEIYQKTLKG